jgi:DNA (cytosine-5)-methyltransferase 1
MTRERTHLDLFSGIGGFALAARNCGVRTVAFCEIEPYAQSVIKKNFDAVIADTDAGESLHIRKREGKGFFQPERFGPIIFPDIRKLNGGGFIGTWLLTGGFPCQPFSLAGKRRGKEDDRHLWPEMLRVIKESGPTWVIGENVAGFVTMELDRCISDLEAIGYAVWPVVIPACAVDAKHRRDRVWIIGHAIGLGGQSAERGNMAGQILHQTERREIADAIGGPSQHEPFVADAAQAECEWPSNSRGRRNGFADGGEPATDADRERGRMRPARRKDAGDAGQSSCAWKNEREWFAESGMGRISHGIPNRVDRLKGLGNAIVPQVAEEIIRAMIATEN